MSYSTVKPRSNSTKENTIDMKGDPGHDTLVKQYGGNHKPGWLAGLPDSWLPYVQLARLSPPAGLCLIYFPHSFGILHAAILQRTAPLIVLQYSTLMFCASFFVSNAIHIWNDLIDAPLDSLVERTRNRPIPRKAVSPLAAIIFTTTQAIGALLFLPYMMGDSLQNALYALPDIVAWTYYPWAKRHTNNPQLILGFCLAWGIIMGSQAIALEPFAIGVFGSGLKPRLEYSIFCLFLASILWTMIYDTIYAHQDLEDDLKAGIKSLAVLYRNSTKSLLWQLLTLMTAFLSASGWLSEMGVMYYLITVGGSLLSLGLMIVKVELNNSQSCWWWFGNGFWFAGGSISGGLLVEYLCRVYL